MAFAVELAARDLRHSAGLSDWPEVPRNTMRWGCAATREFGLPRTGASPAQREGVQVYRDWRFLPSFGWPFTAGARPLPLLALALPPPEPPPEPPPGCEPRAAFCASS